MASTSTAAIRRIVIATVKCAFTPPTNAGSVKARRKRMAYEPVCPSCDWPNAPYDQECGDSWHWKDDHECPNCGDPFVEYSLQGGFPVCDECGLGHVL
jgi:hypothetical protein